MFSVNLCLIATGRYRGLLPRVLDSARKFFCADFETRFFVWSDEPIESRPYATWVPAEHKPWPAVTLHRYRTILAAREVLAQAEYTFYADADLLFVRHVGEEILSDLVGVIHPGHEHDPPARMPFESRLESAAWVSPRWRRRYYIGAFQGGRTERWLAAAEDIDGWIRQDEAQGIVTPWQDESYWVKYLAIHPPTLALTPDYCTYPDVEAVTGRPGNNRLRTRKILHMPKDEIALRTNT